MSYNAKQISDDASFQAFANCYLKEVDQGVWHSAPDWQRQTGLVLSDREHYALEVQLNNIGETLVFAVSYRSVVGRHQICCTYRKQTNQWTWQPIDSVDAIVLLIDNIYADASGNSGNNKLKLELLTRTLESHQVMHDYLSFRANDESLEKLNFIDSEQSLLFGHWLHPTPKSRQGIHAWQHKNYTPEMKAQFQLHFFAVSKALVQQNSIIDKSVEQLVDQIVVGEQLPTFEHDMQLVPVHPLQAQWLLHQDYVQTLIEQQQLIDLGTQGKLFTPTSSVRTLYNSELDFMIKLSIPVKITNSLRQNMAHELEPGLNVGKLLNESDFSKLYPQFSMIEDPAYLTVNLPQNANSAEEQCVESGFETIFRRNLFVDGALEQQTTLSIAALVQRPIAPSSEAKATLQVKALSESRGLSLSEAALLWFENYWHCAIEPAICLYDQQGVALEAHQQNSLLTITDNLPSQYYYRDNQGFYLSKSKKAELLARQPALCNNDDLFYDDSMIADRFGYYLFVNQLFAVIACFGQDGLIAETQLLQVAYNKLANLQPALTSTGVDFIGHLFNKRSIPCKGNLLTRVDDVDELQAEQELAVYTEIRNHIFDFHQKALARQNQQTSEVLCESA